MTPQKQIAIYLANEDKQKIKFTAKSVGLSLSAFMRLSALQNCNKEAITSSHEYQRQ